MNCVSYANKFNCEGCTHFTWTNWNGGTCWMKKNSISKTDAVVSSDSSAVCGVMESNGGDDGMYCFENLN